MFESLWSVFAPRALIASALPVRLLNKYGSSGVYTSAQVRRVVEDLKLTGASAQMAFAVACSSAEFLRAQPNRTLDDYTRLRAEFMELLGLDRSNFNMVDIRRRNRVYRRAWAKAPSTDVASGAYDYW